MNVMLWHVHGAWTTAFVQGADRYLIPVEPGRGPDGRGRAQTYVWPSNAVEIDEARMATEPVDVVVLQRPYELTGLAERWLGGRRPGADVPAVYLEHNAPQGRIADMRHPAADRDDLTIVHVTHFNDLFWDCGSTPATVIEHGVPEPCARYTGELARGAVVVNEPGRRGRVTGTDLLHRLGRAAPLDLFGIASEPFGGRDLPQHELHREMARRRVYLHPNRWTSLGLSLIEAMLIGMPVVAPATTEVAEAVPREAGIISTRLDRLEDGMRTLVTDREQARERGAAARRWARGRYGLERFLRDWRDLLERVVR
jgi:glycosyltransferase involved in cell wall biosynthesis